MRIPIAASLESRDGALTRDALCRNAIVEAVGDALNVRTRPGLVDLGLVRAGTAQLLTYWNGKTRTVIGDYISHVSEFVTHTSTWNASDKGTTVTLSDGNLTVTVTNLSGEYGSVRSSDFIAEGGWYFEFTTTTIGGATANGRIGIANATMSVSASAPGADANAVVLSWYGAASNALVISNGATLADTGVTISNGVIIGVWLSKDNGTLKFHKNGALIYSGTTLPAGTNLYAVAGTGADANFSGTANFGATALTYGPSTVTANLSPTSAGLPFSSEFNGANSPESLLMIKNATQAWTVNTSDTVTQITDVDYPGKYAVTLTSLTRSGSVATATTPADTNFQVGGTVTIAGATPTDYNGAKVLTGVTASASSGSGTASRVTIARSGTTATATSVSEPHGLINGQQAEISGANQSEYNGLFTIAVLSSTAFTFTVTVTNQSPATPATGSPVISGNSQFGQLSNLGIDEDTPFYFYIYNVTRMPLVGQAITLSSPLFPALVGPYTITAVSGGPAGSPAIVTFTVTGYTGPRVFDYNVVATLGTAPTISSITSAGATATVTTAAAHGYSTGEVLQISGATQYQYNGSFSITVTSTTTFTYQIRNVVVGSPDTPATGTITVTGSPLVSPASFTFAIAGTPTTPATGTITATGGRSTVPGIAYLNGYFCVMDVFGVIYNCALDNPSAWNALEYTIAQNLTGAGVAMARSQNYLVAFKEWSTEFFYDAKNPVGSPFSPVENAFTQIGCAQGWSVADIDGALLWISQAKAKGRSVHLMAGMDQQKVSSSAVDRILNADALTTVHAYAVKLDGNSIYILTLVASNLTLVYNLASKVWSTWTSLTIGASVSVSGITRSGTTATVTTSAAHGLSDGDPVKIAGATQTDYNGIFQIQYLSTTTFSIEVANSPTTPATGTILAYPYTESYFKFTKYTNADGADVVLHESDGHLYEIDPDTDQDNAIPIVYFIRTTRLDGGTTALKALSRVTVIGDTVASTAMIRWSDDDSATFSAYRRADLSLEEPMLRRCGAFRRRSIELKHVGNVALNLSALEMEIGG